MHCKEDTYSFLITWQLDAAIIQCQNSTIASIIAPDVLSKIVEHVVIFDVPSKVVPREEKD